MLAKELLELLKFHKAVVSIQNGMLVSCDTEAQIETRLPEFEGLSNSFDIDYVTLAGFNKAELVKLCKRYTEATVELHVERSSFKTKVSLKIGNLVLHAKEANKSNVTSSEVLSEEVIARSDIMQLKKIAGVNFKIGTKNELQYKKVIKVLDGYAYLSNGYFIVRVPLSTQKEYMLPKKILEYLNAHHGDVRLIHRKYSTAISISENTQVVFEICDCTFPQVSSFFEDVDGSIDIARQDVTQALTQLDIISARIVSIEYLDTQIRLSNLPEKGAEMFCTVKIDDFVSATPSLPAGFIFSTETFKNVLKMGNSARLSIGYRVASGKTWMGKVSAEEGLEMVIMTRAA